MQVSVDQSITVAAGDGSGHFKAVVISRWVREESHRTVRDQASSSGGSALTFHQGACVLFDRWPTAAEIVLLRGPILMYLLCDRQGRWFDIKGNPATITLQRPN